MIHIRNDDTRPDHVVTVVVTRLGRGTEVKRLRGGEECDVDARDLVSVVDMPVCDV